MASIILVVVVFVLDALAFVLAIGAEKRRNTVRALERVDAYMCRRHRRRRRRSRSIICCVLTIEEVCVDWMMQAAYVNVDQNARPYCVYGSDAATGYGIGALVLLAAGQAMIMVATRCFCCGRALSPGRWRAFAGFCFITCW